MDTKIGKLNLTKEQIINSRTLSVGKIKGLCYNLDTQDVVITSTEALTDQEINNFKSALIALPLEIQPNTEESARKGRKRQLLDALATLTGLTRKQVLKCFVEITQDQNDD